MIKMALYNDPDITLPLLQDICNSRRNSPDDCYKAFVMVLQDTCNQYDPLEKATYILLSNSGRNMEVIIYTSTKRIIRNKADFQCIVEVEINCYIIENNIRFENYQK